MRVHTSDEDAVITAVLERNQHARLVRLGGLGDDHCLEHLSCENVCPCSTQRRANNLCLFIMSRLALAISFFVAPMPTSAWTSCSRWTHWTAGWTRVGSPILTMDGILISSGSPRWTGIPWRSRWASWSTAVFDGAQIRRRWRARVLTMPRIVLVFPVPGGLKVS